MTKATEHQLLFHTKTESGWQPGHFRARIVMTEDAANQINRDFPKSGVKAMPVYKRYEFVRSKN